MFKYFLWVDTEKPMSEFAIKAVEKEENFFLDEVKTEKELYRFLIIMRQKKEKFMLHLEQEVSRWLNILCGVMLLS